MGGTTATGGTTAMGGKPAATTRADETKVAAKEIAAVTNSGAHAKTAAPHAMADALAKRESRVKRDALAKRESRVRRALPQVLRFCPCVPSLRPRPQLSPH